MADQVQRPSRRINRIDDNTAGRAIATVGAIQEFPIGMQMDV